MNKEYLVFVDSGVGGISTLAVLLKQNKFNVLYFADNKYAPYGSLSRKQIQTRLKTIISHLKTNTKPFGFVFACNTATTSSISFIRKEFPGETFIGTEPAINLAFKLGYKNPLLVATPQTIKQIKSKKNLFCLSLEDFAKNIESFMTNKTVYNSYKILKDILYIKRHVKGCDSLILGCTHYALIKPIIEKYIQIPMFDGNNGVAREISRKFGSKARPNTNKASVQFIFSKDSAPLKEIYKKILNQILANQINLC